MKKIFAKRFLKIISLLLICCLTIFSIPLVQASSEENNKKLEIPSFIDYNENEYKGSRHISRLSKYDNSTDTIGFLNEDGTSTAYIFQTDVRYKDDDGKMQDKDVSIIRSEKRLPKMALNMKTRQMM